MKKIFFVVIIIILAVVLCSCSREMKEKDYSVKSTEYHDNINFFTFTDKNTGVMYLFVTSGAKGGLTPLYNVDGTLRTYGR